MAVSGSGQGLGRVRPGNGHLAPFPFALPGSISGAATLTPGGKIAGAGFHHQARSVSKGMGSLVLGRSPFADFPFSAPLPENRGLVRYGL